MPRLVYPVSSGDLIVPVRVSLTAGDIRTLRAAQAPMPPVILGTGDVDTGSNMTAISAALLSQLPVVSHLLTQAQTAAGPSSVRLFWVSISIYDPGDPAGPALVIPDLEVMEIPTALPRSDTLIGLDVLRECPFTFDGPTDTFWFEF